MARIILTGLNGYGGNLVKELLQDTNNELVAVVSGAPERSEYYLQLMNRGTCFYQTIESCLAKECPDMAIICTPMHIVKSLWLLPWILWQISKKQQMKKVP